MDLRKAGGLTSLALAAHLLATTATAQESDSVSIPGSAGSTAQQCLRMDGLFLSTPFSLKATHSVIGIGIGWDAPGWMIRFDAGLVENADVARQPVSALFSFGGFWKHAATDWVTIYEGVSIGNEIGVHHSFDGNAVSLDILAGCVLRTGGATSFFVEAGSGAALVEQPGAYAGGTTLSAGLRYDIGTAKQPTR